MRANERMIFVGVAIVALAVGFYLLILAPKRNKASELQGQIDQLHSSISTAEQQTSYGEQARQDFPKYYGRMVVLGKAVPAEADTASLLVQLNSISHQTKLDFRSISISDGGSGSGAPAGGAAATGSSSPTSPTGAAQAAASTASTASSAGSTTSTTASATGSSPSPATASAAPAPATEAAAAALPIGATVGPAGLPTLPYNLSMRGGYFDVSNFIGKIDGLVEPVGGGSQLSPDGRLLTIGGFNLQLRGTGPSPRLKADFVINAYSTGSQGLTLGASPSAPAPTSPGETQVQPASAVVAK
jgi:Tfp pilus assembly protein PilO